MTDYAETKDFTSNREGSRVVGSISFGPDLDGLSGIELHDAYWVSAQMLTWITDIGKTLHERIEAIPVDDKGVRHFK